MFQYLVLLEQLRLAHWLIFAGVVLVLFGAVGSIMRGFRKVQPDEAPKVASDREDPPSLQARRGTTTTTDVTVEKRPQRSRPNEPLPYDEDMSELLDLSAGAAQGRTERR